MAHWPTAPRSVASLHLDTKNPRLGRETSNRAPREIIQYLFEHDNAMDIAAKIAKLGYFANEPLLAIKEQDQYIIIEGNRRLAALKALREPGLLENPFSRQIERLARQIEDPDELLKVPVTIAPTRRATDRLLAGRHIGTAVEAWRAENRASFILDKLAEGYTNERLLDDLGFSSSDIQAARQTRAIADMVRSIELPEEVKAKLDNPKVPLFSTLKRVVDSTVGREFLRLQPDAEHGIRGTTTKAEFLRAFTKLVSDIALGRASSRTLNKNEDITRYFKGWKVGDLPADKRGSFVPADIIQGKTVSSPSKPAAPEVARGKRANKMVIPRSFKVRYGSDRLLDIRNELARMKRETYPNSGAVLLRVFFELSILDYLGRTGALPALIADLEQKQGGKKLPFGAPTLRQLLPTVQRIAKAKLPEAQALRVEKAIKYDASAPFTISELHGFVHQTDLPSARDIEQFWNRTEPLFRLMLEQDHEEPTP